MKRTGSESGIGNGNILIIRGNPSSLGPSKEWKSAYYFMYDNNGLCAVSKTVNLAYAYLKAWSKCSAIHTGGWNTLKVFAVSNSLKFYINGMPVWSGSNSQLPSGAVGVGFYRTIGSTANKLYIDWATLSTSVAPGGIEVR